MEATRDEVCSQALDAAAEAMDGLDRLNTVRRGSGKPIAKVDLALHLGEVLYGNVGAVDRLDFTVIGPAVKEVARIETLCEPLGCKVLISAELAAAVGARRRLEPLGYHKLRGVRKPNRSTGSISALKDKVMRPKVFDSATRPCCRNRRKWPQRTQKEF